jgi:tRNA nucleotidyltransferase (CCA-adding enzyme)
LTAVNGVAGVGYRRGRGSDTRALAAGRRIAQIGGMKAYLVGGIVRDTLLNLELGLGVECKDRDWVVVGATPQEMLAAGYRQVGADFPVFLHPETGEEHALARTERRQGRGHRGFVVHAAPDVTLEADLARRDLTINAMAYDEAADRLIDPYGGLADLRGGVLRHVSPAFVEDPLRVLRVARFAARLPEFALADETRVLMAGMAAGGDLAELTPERVWNEIARALGERRPRRFLEVLRDAGALAVVLPEVERLFGVPQPAIHHPEIDTGLHTLMALDAACGLSPDPAVRFAALLHDVGKGVTPTGKLPAHHGHDAAGVPLVETLCERLRVPNRFRDLAVDVCREHVRVHDALRLRPATVLDVLERTRAFRDAAHFDAFLLACQADARGRLGRESDPYPQADLLRRARQAALPVAGAQFVAQGHAAGPRIGELVRQERVRRIRTVMAREV